MAEKKIEKWRHPSCNCPAAKETKYCSDYWEGIGKHPFIVCNCGPAACAAGEAAGAARESVESFIVPPRVLTSVNPARKAPHLWAGFHLKCVSRNSPFLIDYGIANCK